MQTLQTPDLYEMLTGGPESLNVKIFTFDESATWKIPASARLVAETYSCWSGWHSSEDKFLITTEKTRSRWYLWYAFFDDNYSEWVYRPYAGCLKKGVPQKLAAIWLLQYTWNDMKWSYETPKPQDIYAGCVLTEEELKAIAAHVWPGGEEEEEE